ncbi:hypothetical protein [Nocardia sp. alder85J]|uniref:hypothetical protein n=1 Tax=Nocardia sp. alder85J TaxID=2862949 RepID=UPI001CD80EA6|nr:hypothetical protein [Nocardia sp. alder85J]MCX4094547.1 hypothetical protein [Nocardia sp. alder85J]
MPHLFTASWIDDSENVCALADEVFDAWVEVKSDAAYGFLQSSRHTSESPGRLSFRACLTETLPDGTRETTEVAAIRSRDRSDDPPSGWLTVDVHRSGEDRHDYLSSPWLVQQLIARGVRPRFADDPLSVSPTVVRGQDGGEALAAQVTDFERRIPVVVLSSEPELFARLRRERSNLADIAAETARSCAGLARVVLIEEAARVQFNDAVGSGLAVDAGGLRVFRPDTDPAVDADARRHPHRRAEAWYPHPATAPGFVGRLLASDALIAAHAAVTV